MGKLLALLKYGGIIIVMDKILALLSHTAIAHHVRKHTVLLCQGEVPQEVHIVRSGCVKVYRLNSSGDEHIAGFKTAGDIFPECWAFGHTANTMYYYETTEDTEIATVLREDFMEMLDKNPDVRTKLFDYMVKNYTGLMVQVSALEQSHAVDKLLMMLYYLMIRHSVEKKPGEFWLSMKLRHATLAGLTGLTRETVSTELGKLKKKGVVHYSLRRFVIHRQALREMIGEAAFAEIQLD